MKIITISRKKWHILNILTVLSFLLLTTRCEIQKDFDYVPNNSTGELDLTTWEYIQQNDSLSLMEEAIIATGLQDFYSGTTEKTFIVPRNSAFRSYMKTNRYANIAAIPIATLENVLKYHIVKRRVIFSDPELLQSNNPIAYETENGQIMYLSHNTNFQGIINYGTKKSWTIITSNLQPNNGVIHITADVVYLSL